MQVKNNNNSQKVMSGDRAKLNDYAVFHGCHSSS